MLSENFYFAPMAIKVDLKCVCLLEGKRSWDLKYLKAIFNDNRLVIIHMIHNEVPDLKMYLLSNQINHMTIITRKWGFTLKYLITNLATELCLSVIRSIRAIHEVLNK